MTPEKKDNIPEGWHTYTLGEIYTERKEAGDPELPILTVSIHSGVSDGALDEEEIGKTVKRIADKTQYKTARAGDLVFNMMRAWQGAIGVARSDGLVSPAYIVAMPNEELVYPLFMDYYMKSPKMVGIINRQSYGVTDFRKRLYWNSFAPIKCTLPSLAEQKKIVEILDTQDKLLVLQNKKVDKYRKLKEGLLFNVYPKIGKEIPDLRAKGFSSNWKYKKFGEIFKEYSEKGCPQLPPLTIMQGGGTILREESERALLYDKSSLNGYKVVQKGDFIVHLRSFEGGLERATKHGLISPAYHTYHGENIDSNFYYAYFRSKRFIDIQLKPHVYGIRDGRSIDNEGMKMIRIPSPSLAEQEKIGSILECADRLIALQQKKAVETKNCQKALMQLLLTGIVRV